MPMKVSKLKTLPFVEENNETVLKVDELVRFLRKHVTEGDKAIRIDNLKLELSKKKELRTEKPTVTVTECLPSQCINHTNGVHAFVESKAEADFGSLEIQATLVRSDLNKTHGVVVPEVIFLEENTLNGYSCKQCTNDNYHKFHLRDDYFSGKLGHKIVHVLYEYDEDYIDLLQPKTLKHQDDDDNVYYNLVRWSIHADPDPGKTRTSQICTLSITIKGLPKQSYTIKSWHQKDCDLLVNCNCMQQIKLGKDQCKLLLEYEYEEKEILDVQTRLGIGLLVPALKTFISECTDIFNQHIEDENILDISKELGNLDISMEST
ncbi:Hypothetical predicted protein [Mytilus galloprovincialis]|uniref:Uncharacterized protein n=1 Tax=Mytilus galloprovincialis TaxID=29158 RepID=A0A8B6EEM5_MYTGA|nr:Hypothetical predicted protein [Mytilus galloprovincialis]